MCIIDIKMMECIFLRNTFKVEKSVVHLEIFFIGLYFKILILNSLYNYQKWGKKVAISCLSHYNSYITT